MKDIDTWIKDQSGLLADLKIAIDSFKESLNPESHAIGGYIPKPTLSFLAEKEPEWVVPQSKIGEFVKQMSGTSSIGFSIPNKTDVNYKGFLVNIYSSLKETLQKKTEEVKTSGDYNVTISPQIIINPAPGTSAKEIALETETVVINSLKYGKGRVEVQKIVKGIM